MRACVLTAPKKLAVADAPDLEMGPGLVRLRPTAVGLCGTDYHIWLGEANYNFDENGTPIPLATAPQIMGHEFTGIVTEVDASVTDVAVGDHVVVDQGLNCHSFAKEEICEYCATGDSHQCEWYREHGITGVPGALAEEVVTPAVNLVKIEGDLLAAHAAMTEPLACVLHANEFAARATTRYSLDGDGDDRVRTALVFGAGPAGLLFVQVLRRVHGFEGNLLVSDPDPAKRKLAASWGAEIIDPSTQDIAEVVHERTKGRRVEYLVDASGAGPVFHEIPRLMRKQATVILYGHGHGGIGMEALNAVQFKEPALISPVGASGGFDGDRRPTIYRRALRLIEDGDIDVAPIITHTAHGLAEVPEAFSKHCLVEVERLARSRHVGDHHVDRRREPIGEPSLQPDRCRGDHR